MKIKKWVFYIFSGLFLISGSIFASTKANTSGQLPTINNGKKANLILKASASAVTAATAVNSMNNKKEVYNLIRAKDEYTKKNTTYKFLGIGGATKPEGSGEYLLYQDGIEYANDVIAECKSRIKDLTECFENIIDNTIQIKVNYPTKANKNESKIIYMKTFVNFGKELDSYQTIENKDKINQFIASISRSSWIPEANSVFRDLINNPLKNMNEDIKNVFQKIQQAKIPETDKATIKKDFFQKIQQAMILDTDEQNIKKEFKDSLHLNDNDILFRLNTKNEKNNPCVQFNMVIDSIYNKELVALDCLPNHEYNILDLKTRSYDDNPKPVTIEAPLYDRIINVSELNLDKKKLIDQFLIFFANTFCCHDKKKLNPIHKKIEKIIVDYNNKIEIQIKPAISKNNKDSTKKK